MKITTNILKEIDSSVQLFCDDMVFDYIDLLDYSSKPSTIDFQNILYVLTSSKTEEDESWYSVKFDRINKFKRFLEFKPKSVILSDMYIDGVERQIVVSDVTSFVRNLYGWVLSKVKPIVVGVTGSVGKTTCVCVLEDVLSLHGKTLRIYAKRITPLCLFETVINQLQPDHEYIVMEYSMYFKWHIAHLVQLLPPQIAFLINIETAHIGVDGIQSCQDIWESKKGIFLDAKYLFVELGCLDVISLDNQNQYSVFDFKKYLKLGDLFVRSKLSFIQIAVSLITCEILFGEISESDLSCVLLSKPQEKRMMKVKHEKLDKGSLFFDGEATNASRVNAVAETLYPRKYLVLCDVEFYEQKIDNQSDQFRKALDCFDKVFVSRTLNAGFYNFVLDNLNRPVFFDNLSDVFGEIETCPDTAIFVHWGGYWKHNQYLPEHLIEF